MSALPFVSDTFDPTRWREVEGFDFVDITYHRGISRGPETDGRPEGADMPVVRIGMRISVGCCAAFTRTLLTYR